MATEMPVKDVLCEAMEYLSKLGSNLRTRSEKLKEKKIRKDKLNNALAMQKAADKVLLICELSKRSLDNVESGVRKIMEHIDVSQASLNNKRVGGKSGSKTDCKERDHKPKYHYFDYKSRKLKIKTKISLKHYRSVKVHAKKMSVLMIEKYPVYHDCKLYRIRKREEKSKNKNIEPEQQKDENNDSPNVPLENQASDAEEEENSDSTMTNKSRKRFSDKTLRRTKKFRVIDTDSEDQEKSYDTCLDNENNTNKIQQETNACNVEPEPKKRKISETESMLQNDNDILLIHSDNENENPSNSKNDKEGNGSDSKERGVESAKDSIGGKSNDSSNRSENKNNTEMPIIKCVKLSYLLKPDILNKDSTESHEESNSKKVISKHLRFDVYKKNKMLQNAKKNKEEFWASKRKEVSKFKPKRVSVHITRLPELSTDFLIHNNIKSITKDGITICKIAEDEFHSSKDKQPSINENSEKSSNAHKGFSESSLNPNNVQIIDQANQIKNSLLNESDSDIDTAFKHKKNKIKKALLNSDSDQNDSNDTSKAAQEKDKKQVHKNSDDDKISKSDSDANDNKKYKAKRKKSSHKKAVSDSEAENDLLDKSDSGNKRDKSENDNDCPEPLMNKKAPDKEFDKISLSDSDSNNDRTSQAEKETGPVHKKSVNDSEAAKNDLLDKSDSENKSYKSDNNCIEDGKKVENSSVSVSDCLESLRNQKTPDKELSTVTDNAKNILLNDSPDDVIEAPLSQRKAVTPQSKKKHIRESVQAKHALLRYSSGSETEDEQLRNTLNEIKKSLLEAMSDDENKLKSKNLVKQHRSSQESSSSAEDILKQLRNEKSHKLTNSSKKKYTKRKKLCINSDTEEEKKSSSDDDKSTSYSSKMVRSKAKPGNSSSHSSDVQDPNDKDIDGLTDLRSLNKLRRRNSDAAGEAESSNSTGTKSRMAAKPTGVIGDDILKAETSSDAASNDEDDAVDEDLPPVTMPGFNGGSEHLVKEDLLGESDSSVSAKNENKDDSEDEERLNAKRRKAIVIASSDSEAGNVPKREKDGDVRLSDFEDSDDSEITKRTKRQRKGSDTDGSAGSTDAGKQKKRRRIKSVNDSDASGSDSENEGKNKHGRKNIRKVMGKNQLEEATKKAAREEKERVARIAERQKMYNNLQFDESGKPDEVVLDRVVLDFDPDTKEPLIAVDRGLVKKLKPHQANGIKFMWDACFESVKRIKKAGSGCILAHCMGLGKTLQVVALTHTLLAHDSLTKVNRVLVVCPLSTVLNWVNEFKMWLKHAERDSDIDVYELSRFKQNGERAFQLSQWFEHGGVCVLGYEMFRNLSADNNKKFKKKMLKNFQEALVDPGPDLVVCDEGHLLKNEKTSLSQSMNKVRTLRRIVLTGTPLQNNLKEYYCMVQFVKPNLLGKYNEYLNRFVNPITNGQYTDSTEHDIKIMKRRSHVLHKMLDGAVQRRDYGVLAPFLPPKHEYVLFITLTEVQTKLYQFYLDNYSRRPLPGKSSGFLFPDFQSLQRIWTHPLVLKYNSERYEIMQQKKRDKEEEDSEGSLVDFIDDDSTPSESTTEDSSDDSSEMSDDSRKKSKKKKSSKKSKGKDKDKDKDSVAASRRRGTRANPIDLDLEEDKDDDIMEVKNENPTEWWIKMVEEEEIEDMRNSHKLVLLFDILRQCETIGDKLLVFSQSLYSLDLIEHFLGKVDEATQDGRIDEKLGGHVGSWSPGVDYFRLDGSTSCENRSIWCKNFNREDNPRARLFLISTRAGGLGINLVAANRVVIFDVSWNPSHDVQSIFRVYRFGQKKPCYVYRFLAMGTMEEKIYERQVTKQAISKRVIDEQQIDRHYAENDLAELYKFEAEPPSPRPLPPLPKDRLFAEMLREHEAQIYKYHEHDSLLENKEEETLSEEERKAAWEDFENEKNRPPPAPFPSPWPMSNGMMPNLLAQQQQQLAYAALAAMLRKDMPNVNDNQIRDMLPMIYNANPALMQKMSEIYKYSQQMSMSPAMMAQSGMNSASGAMAGMGSTSGLQYEPPWQRQQQQQQQMRLQQLMAQQQNMGAAAKFYAGGLGSRDPVAMALQQQRAREIMVGGGAGRPRGRPPLQPRAPPTPSADVVNLDSD